MAKKKTNNNNNTELSKLVQDLMAKGLKIESLIRLTNKSFEKEQRKAISFDEFLYQLNRKPESVLRDIFQLVYDMVHHYVPDGYDEYPTTGDSIGYMHFDSSKLFEDCNDPFFGDRLFINRFMKLIDSFKTNIQKNRIYLFEGPPGSGKSTFLNNFLHKLEEYSHTENGIIYKTNWQLDIAKIRHYNKFEKQITSIPELEKQYFDQVKFGLKTPDKLVFSCPNHDHPILQIPIEYRAEILSEIITDKKLKKKIFTESQYQWIFKEKPCSICKTVHSALVDSLDDPMDIYHMIYAKPMLFNRQLGDGISVFNPGDNIIRNHYTNQVIQEKLNTLFEKTSINFIYSHLAKTNNGVYALMDIKENNIERLRSLHGIISDGVHKVELIEENVKSFFIGLINPSDNVHYEQIPSFKDRVVKIKMPYILDYNTEVKIYRNKFGDIIKKKFLPGVIQNFAKIIISSRMDKENTIIKKWITRPEKYRKYVDKNLLLLKMDIYTGTIPDWLDNDDVSKLDFQTRKAIINSANNEGFEGFSGRKTLSILNNFISKYGHRQRSISMQNVEEFFNSDEKLSKKIPEGFIGSIIDLYDYDIMQQIKESIFDYNEEKISKDILDYLFAINFNPGTEKKSPYTGNEIEISEEYFKQFEIQLLGAASTKDKRDAFRKEQLQRYVTETLAQEIKIKNKKITETEQYKELYELYTKRIKENVLEPYKENASFRRAIIDYGTDAFKSYDKRLRENIEMLIDNLHKNYKYSKHDAAEICIYAIDKGLIDKY